MAGDWIKWVKGLIRRREVVVIARKLNLSCRESAAACMELWEWADGETTNGHIRGATKEDIDLMLKLPGFSEALESPEVGWARFSDNGMTLSRWERNNGESAKKRALNQRKKAQQRDLGKRQNGHRSSPSCPPKCPPSVPSGAAQEGGPEKRREEREKKDSLAKAKEPPLPPLPSILDTGEFRATLSLWLQSRSKPYKPAGLKMMVSRAAARARDHGLAAVITAMERAMANDWQGWDQDSSFSATSRGSPSSEYNRADVLSQAAQELDELDREQQRPAGDHQPLLRHLRP